MTGVSEFIDAITKKNVDFSKDELKKLIKDAKEDDRLFIRHMGELTEEFIGLRALGQITNDEFEELMKDVIDLNKMQFDKLSVAAKVRAQRILR